MISDVAEYLIPPSRASESILVHFSVSPQVEELQRETFAQYISDAGDPSSLSVAKPPSIQVYSMEDLTKRSSDKQSNQMFMEALGNYVSEKIVREVSSLKAVDSKFNDKDIQSSVGKTL